MFNPYKKFTQDIWQQCQADKTPYLISQTFKRGFPTYRKSNPTCILLTPYTQFAEARQRHQQQSQDSLASFIQLSNPKHKQSIERLLNSGTDYIPYWGIIPNEQYIFHLRHTQWQHAIAAYIKEYNGQYFTSGKSPSFQLRQLYGELIIHITQGKESWHLKLEEIEREGMLT